MERKTLWQRLLPENQEKLNQCREQYPFTVKTIETDLQDNYYIPDLSFGTISYLYNMLDMRSDNTIHDDFLKIYRAFADVEVANFENKNESTVVITE